MKIQPGMVVPAKSGTLKWTFTIVVGGVILLSAKTFDSCGAAKQDMHETVAFLKAEDLHE